MEVSENGIVSPDSLSSGSGSTISSKRLQYLDSRFECPICLSCLKSPYITTCGHKFCKACILEWLHKDENRSTCPIDSEKLVADRDLFPDNYTKREISQQIVTCPFPECSKPLPLLEAEMHMYDAHPNDKISTNDAKLCPFAKVGCKYELFNQSQALNHLQTYMSHHLLLLMAAFDRLNNDLKSNEAEFWDPPSKSESSSSTALLKTLYEKIVYLEQIDHEKSINVKALTVQMKNVMQQMSAERPRRTEGVLVWKVEKISQLVHCMQQDSTMRMFSDGFYTSYFGYKFCCRLNVSVADPDYLSLNVHLMKGESDYTLQWPFSGRITLSLVHPRDSDLSLREVMASNPSVEAFRRPSHDISLRGFGYADFIKLSDLEPFVSNDSILIRVEIVCI